MKKTSIKKTETYFERNGKELKVRLTTKKARLKYARVCLYCSADFISNRKTALYCCDAHRVYAFKENKAQKKKEEGIAAMRLKMLSI